MTPKAYPACRVPKAYLVTGMSGHRQAGYLDQQPCSLPRFRPAGEPKVQGGPRSIRLAPRSNHSKLPVVRSVNPPKHTYKKDVQSISGMPSSQSISGHRHAGQPASRVPGSTTVQSSSVSAGRTNGMAGFSHGLLGRHGQSFLTSMPAHYRAVFLGNPVFGRPVAGNGTGKTAVQTCGVLL